MPSASAITLEAGKTFQVELSPVLQPYYPVRIAVTNLQAPNGMDVSVASHEGHKPSYTLGYNGEGIEGMLPNGIYTVEATVQQGLQTATGSVNITVKDAPLTNASMVVLPNGSIPVNITDEGGGERSSASFRREPSRASKRLRSSCSPPKISTLEVFASLRPPRKSNDNDLVLENVRPGRYWLKVAPHRGYVASAGAGSADLLRQPLVVGPGGANPRIEIVLRDDGATIDGTVEGMPAAPADRRSPMTTIRSGPFAMAAGPWVYCIPLPDSPGRFFGKLGFAAGDFPVGKTFSGRLSRAGIRSPSRRTRISECPGDE